MDIRPLTVDAGGSKTFVVTVYSDSGKTALHPLTGYTAKMQVKDRYGGNVFSELTSPSGGITINTTTSEITVVIPAEDTATFRNKMVYDIKLTKANDTVYPVGGEITVVKTVTS